MSEETLAVIRSGAMRKGNPLQVAELAGIMAGKRTADLIPLCHQLQGASLEVSLEPDAALPGVVCRARAHVSGQTGVEMEALTAVAVALLTLYDMVKGVDRGLRIEQIRLAEKEGGRSGRWTAP
jgi:cyclic pyranopterin phosphate synthase